MSFASLLAHTVTVKRPTATTGVKKTYQTSSSGVVCLIQPLDMAATQATGMAFGKAFKCYALRTADIREGDELVDQDSNVYFVKGIRNRNYGSFPHLDMLLERDKRP